MDSIFQLSEGDRAAFLQHISNSFHCTFICLWSYLPQPSNCLLFLDGVYHEDQNKHPRSSSAQGLFHEYQKSVFLVDNGGVPGLAFKNSLPYIEFKELDLQTLSSTETQLQFYQEAQIKTAIYMGCKFGEIELGISIDTQANLEMQMRNWFPEDFRRQKIPREISQLPTDQNPQSPSSSSLISLSIDSPDQGSSFLTTPVQEAIQTLGKVINFSTIESEEAAMTQAILAVISSSSSSPPSSSSCSSSYHQPQQIKSSAFKSYSSVLGPTSQITSGRLQKQNMLKRAIAICRAGSSLMGSQEKIGAGNRPANNQVHHMISERKRREKLNESFQALRSLLPPGSKKDKASVLSSTTEYMNSLKSEVEKLTKRNHILEAQLQQNKATDDQKAVINDGSLIEKLDVRITNVVETNLEARILDLKVIVRGECSMLDLGIRVLEFLKQLGNVSLISVEADTRMVENASVKRLVLRLKIEGGEWDDTAFQEAATRVVADLA